MASIGARNCWWFEGVIKSLGVKSLKTVWSEWKGGRREEYMNFCHGGERKIECFMYWRENLEVGHMMKEREWLKMVNHGGESKIEGGCWFLKKIKTKIEDEGKLDCCCAFSIFWFWLFLIFRF